MIPENFYAYYDQIVDFFILYKDNFFLSLSIIFISLFITKLSYNFFNNIILNRFKSWLSKGTIKYGNLLIKNSLIKRLTKLIFTIFLYQIALNLPNQTLSQYSIIISELFIIIFIVGVLFSSIDASYDLLQTNSVDSLIPLKAISQFIKFVLILAALLFSISILIDKSPLILLSGIGAFSAILILVFKDIILNFVAVFHIRMQKSIEIGDWIEVKNFGADGDVTDINVTGVIILNFDKTTTIIPPYMFLTTSFKNYSSMKKQGRRIKRSINIDVNSVKFLTDSDINGFQDIPILKNYIIQKKEEIQIIKNSNDKNFDTNNKELFKNKNLTNLGTFRVYIEEYIKNNINITKEHTILVRQLENEGSGIPIEIYCFTSNTEWVFFERVQSDIFDHLYAIIKEFDLEIFQNISSKKNLKNT